MSNRNVPAKRGQKSPLVTGVLDFFTRTDFDRQGKTVQRLRDGGMQHGHTKMTSKHEIKIQTKTGTVTFTKKNTGEYRW